MYVPINKRNCRVIGLLSCNLNIQWISIMCETNLCDVHKVDRHTMDRLTKTSESFDAKHNVDFIIHMYMYMYEL